MVAIHTRMLFVAAMAMAVLGQEEPQDICEVKDAQCNDGDVAQLSSVSEPGTTLLGTFKCDGGQWIKDEEPPAEEEEDSGQ
ncbi:hypothetical protein GGF46_005260 [Coemansia sp. RSA 552]|nr:hypothetical protein GGF46_005260 [Coemansia sp. RSA 552]